jgi:hypothetical protein
MTSDEVDRTVPCPMLFLAVGAGIYFTNAVRAGLALATARSTAIIACLATVL